MLISLYSLVESTSESSEVVSIYRSIGGLH
jgi:hypothetical protein